MMTATGAELRNWVDTVWPQLQLLGYSLKPDFHKVGDRVPQWQALPGDAGFRRYFRLSCEPPLLAVHAPPDTEDSQAFIDIARLLRESGVLTPLVLVNDLSRGFLIIEDLGGTLLLDVLQADNADTLYASALESLFRIQTCQLDYAVFPSYDREKLGQEMALFSDWFVHRLLGISPSIAEDRMLETVFRLLEDSAVEQPQIVVHRDYHSRNLIYREGGLPGVIDFQDAVIGPWTYDLVSLLRDCYITWPQQQVHQWALNYARLAQRAELVPAFDEAHFLRWFDLMGLQRHIKVLGIFARLSLRDGKHRYLNDLPTVIHYVLSVARQYPECARFVQWFDGVLLPRIESSDWHEARP